MLLSDIVGKALRGPDGSPRGTVMDVRFRRGPRDGRHEGPLQVVALVVTRHSRLPMYGYERGRVTRPAPLATLIGWLHRDSRIVPWDCVERVDADAVVLGVEPPRIPLDTTRPVSD
ncbi:MAG: hypothetical protein QM626_13885 [Microbacterium sp.]|uniref:hypothetical protein n=1 Tax=Microbacterium sp. TaxID=51671 RepID=UPI0039E6B46B